MAIEGPGFYDMPAEVYHADPAPKPSLSSGLLADVITGTVLEAKEGHPRLGNREPEVDNKKFDVGTIAHTLVLGKGREIVPLDYDAWTTKAAKEDRAAALAEGKSPVKAADYERALLMRTRLFEQLAEIPGEEETFHQLGTPEAPISFAEQAAFWQEPTALGRLWNRSLMDWRRGDRPVIRDYKTFGGQRGADPDGFVKWLCGEGKDIQDPHYSAGMAAVIAHQLQVDIAWDEVDFAFVVQDPNPPFLVSVVKLYPEDREWSYERRRWAIDRWAANAGSGLWRGFEPLVHEVRAPGWAKSQWEWRMLNTFEAEQKLAEMGRPALDLKAPDEYRVADDEIKV
jgi:hypothetical protein